MASAYVVERLNHLGIVAVVCHEIGVVEWLDQQKPANRQQVSVGTDTVALALNGQRQVRPSPTRFANRRPGRCCAGSSGVFEGIDLLHSTQPHRTHIIQTLRLEQVHRLLLQLLGPAYENSYLAIQGTAE